MKFELNNSVANLIAQIQKDYDLGRIRGILCIVSLDEEREPYTLWSDMSYLERVGAAELLKKELLDWQGATNEER